jgi:hypothetical protein
MCLNARRVRRGDPQVEQSRRSSPGKSAQKWTSPGTDSSPRIRERDSTAAAESGPAFIAKPLWQERAAAEPAR